MYDTFKELRSYISHLGFEEKDNWTNGDYFTYSDVIVGGDGYDYAVKIYVPTNKNINGEISVSWIEAGTSSGKTPDHFESLDDLDGKKVAIRREEEKLLLLKIPFNSSYRFDNEEKKILNQENRKLWRLSND